MKVIPKQLCLPETGSLELCRKLSLSSLGMTSGQHKADSASEAVQGVEQRECVCSEACMKVQC
jgi:hypothetical protein